MVFLFLNHILVRKIWEKLVFGKIKHISCFFEQKRYWLIFFQFVYIQKLEKPTLGFNINGILFMCSNLAWWLIIFVLISSFAYQPLSHVKRGFSCRTGGTVLGYFARTTRRLLTFFAHGFDGLFLSMWLLELLTLGCLEVFSVGRYSTLKAGI